MATSNGTSKANRFLIWGGEGWVAGHLEKLLKSQGKEVFTTTIRMENRESVLAELERVKPTHVLNAAGCTGRPNVDWCEDNKEATMRSNVIGTLNLTDACFLKGIHCTVFATGCIYQYDETHPWDGPGYVETDPANFSGSFYSLTKAHVEEVSYSPTSHAAFKDSRGITLIPFVPLCPLGYEAL
jgi:nucleoside-diphosphate-sugar epimerase